MSRNGTFKVTADHHEHRLGRRATDVVQLYLHERRHEHPAARREARGVPAGDARARDSRTTVTFTLGPQNLGFYNNNGQFVVEPGPFKLWVGDSSTVDAGTPTTFTLAMRGARI